MPKRPVPSAHDLAFGVPFGLFALAYVSAGLVAAVQSSTVSWVLVFVVIVGVVVCGPFRLHIGQAPGVPFFGVAAMLLPLHVSDSPLITVAVWSTGLLITQVSIHRNAVVGFYATGLSGLGAFAFVSVLALMPWHGWARIVTFAVAAACYYAVLLLGEFARQGGRWGMGQSFGFSVVSPVRLGALVAIVAVAGTLIDIVDSAVIPWLERDPHTAITPVVVLLLAVAFLVLALRSRYAGVERRLRAVVSAAAELPWDTTAGLAPALGSRVREILHASDVEIRGTAPGDFEIGAPVSLEYGVDQYVVASRKVGGAPFTMEDGQALAALAHMASETARVQREVDTLERRANSDPLTGLPNYGAFQRALMSANQDRSYRAGIAVLFLDLDDFKKLNDSRGHHAGDELLKTVADRLLAASGGSGFVSRVGGDEFVVILRELVSLPQAKEIADRIIQAVGQPFALEGQDLRPVVSAGLAYSGYRELDAQTLVVDADRSMLQVKRSRRQGGPVEGSSLSIASHRSTRTNDIVAGAIRDDRLDLAFQPIVSIDRGRIWAFEALVRYVDPELGPISPSSLVARAKSLGLMNELTKQIIGKALDAAEEFHRLEPGIGCITVNLELEQISEDQLGGFICDAALAHPEVSLCVELNERSLRSATDDLRREAEVLRDAGIIIALDDYGSDDSSVGALVRFPMDILKIDRSLVDDLTDVRQREVIKALQGFGDNLDYTMVVEGIESPEMVDVMVELGVRSAQGYYYGHPLSFQRTVDRIRKWGTQAVIEQ